MLSVVTLKVRASVGVQDPQVLATRLLEEQSATEVKALDEVSQIYQKVRVLARATKATMSKVTPQK
jgi:hypothetical protein